jgi:hypothetical protein
MLATSRRLGSARVPACNFRRPAGKTLFGETPNTTRGDAYAPQTFGDARWDTGGLAEKHSPLKPSQVFALRQT